MTCRPAPVSAVITLAKLLARSIEPWTSAISGGAPGRSTVWRVATSVPCHEPWTSGGDAVAEKIWVVDNEPSQNYPIYTRGNVGEVFPEAVAPLTWTMFGIPGAETGWRDALERFGAFDQD